jgi:hypothetical protein
MHRVIHVLLPDADPAPVITIIITIAVIKRITLAIAVPAPVTTTITTFKIALSVTVVMTIAIIVMRNTSLHVVMFPRAEISVGRLPHMVTDHRNHLPRHLHHHPFPQDDLPFNENIKSSFFFLFFCFFFVKLNLQMIELYDCFLFDCFFL